jgi:hypothetical protein
MRNVLKVPCLILVSIFSSSASSPPRENISGRVIAYSSPLACLNGNADWSMVIRAQPTKNIQNEFIRVDFTLPCGKSPEWISSKPSVQKFRLVRRKECDAALAGSANEGPKESPVFPSWTYLPGAEHDSLPFGQVLPCYRSLDLPLVPVV